MFGRPLRGFLPVHPSVLDGKEDFASHRQAKKALKEKAKEHHDKTAHELPDLKPGDKVLVQDTATSKWDKRGTITGIRRSGSFDLRMTNGTVTNRNRRLLRPDKTTTPAANKGKKRQVIISEGVHIKEIPPRDEEPPPRAKSSRKKTKPQRFRD